MSDETENTPPATVNEDGRWNPDAPDPILGTHAGQIASGSMISCQNFLERLPLGLLLSQRR